MGAKHKMEGKKTEAINPDYSGRFIATNKEELLEVIYDRGRCAICGDLANAHAGYFKEEPIFSCSPDHEEKIKKFLGNNLKSKKAASKYDAEKMHSDGMMKDGSMELHALVAISNELSELNEHISALRTLASSKLEA